MEEGATPFLLSSILSMFLDVQLSSWFEAASHVESEGPVGVGRKLSLEPPERKLDPLETLSPEDSPLTEAIIKTQGGKG